jgi:hypothetical protein
MEGTGNTAYLTFDDSPVPEMTPEIPDLPGKLTFLHKESA